MSDTDPDGRGPIDAIELVHAMAGAAETVHTLYLSLLEQGFTEVQALGLAAAFLHGVSGGKLS